MELERVYVEMLRVAPQQNNSAIHKAAGRAIPGFAWYNSCGTEKCPLAVNGSRQQERPPEVVLYGGRPYGGFVNSAVRPSGLGDGGCHYSWISK